MLIPDPCPQIARVKQVAVPQATRELSALGRIDYADAFVVEVGTGGHETAEEWAREVLEGAPAWRRGQLTSGWSALGLKLDLRASSGTILGWPVRCSTPTCVALAAESRLGMPAELIFWREPDALHFSTFVRHDNAVVRAIWARVEPLHVPIVLEILEQARPRAT